MKKLFVLLLAVLVVGSLALVACDDTEETTTTEAVETTVAPDTTDTTAAAAMEITWDQAADYLDETATVTGPVVAVDDKGAGIEKYLINIGSTEEAEGFNALVNYADADKFGDLNELVGKEVAVTGLIYENQFELKAEIECTDPSQIEVLGDAAGDMGGMAYTTTEARDHYDEDGTITGEVVNIRDLGEEIGKWLIQLDSEDDGAGANGMITYENAGPFASMLDALVGQTVEITGTIYENGFQDKPEIELTDVSQLVVK